MRTVIIMIKEESDRWYSINKTREYLVIKRNARLTWIEKRGKPLLKIGRTWKFKISEIDEWMRSVEDKKSKDTYNG